MARRYIHIAVGVLRNARGDVLICQRPAHKLYPGEWEFPGGKVEPGEDVQRALRRELHEELGVEVQAAEPLIRLRHVYPELSVDLDTWLVTAWSSEPRSTEHPAIAWVAAADLPRWRLLAADRPIVSALRLPAHYVFTPEALPPDLLERAARLPACLLRLRLPALPPSAYRQHARQLAPAMRKSGGGLMVDRSSAQVRAWGVDGFHATSAILRRLKRRPVPRDKWFAASCHNARELARARRLGADLVVLGPVHATASHPRGATLGWDGFRTLAQAAGIPVYAIGGVGPDDLAVARRHGAHGVAGISAFWGSRA